MSRIIAAALSLTSLTAFASLPAATPVDTNAGDQTDPHVSASRVAYTDQGGIVSVIRYYDLNAGTGGAVPGSGLGDTLSDISGNTIVFTRNTSDGSQRVFMWNWGDSTASELNHSDTPVIRQNAAIGSQTVAWEERTSGTPKIATYSLVTSTGEVIADPGTNVAPAVSAAGDLVTWTNCNAGACAIHSASAATGWTATTQATGVFSNSTSDTNGTVIVYDAQGAADRDVFVQTVGGARKNIAMPAGADTNPNIAGNLVAFEHFDPAAGSTDIWLYDISKDSLTQLTNSPADEFLNDISIDGDTVRVVFATPSSNGDFDVYATSFSAVPNPNTCEPFPTNLSASDACAELEQHGTPVAQYTLTRNNGAPGSAQATSTASGRGIVCVGSHHVSSGTVKQNGATVFGQSSFNHNVTSVAKYVTLTGSDTFSSTVASSPGSSLEVKVYALDSECAPPADDDVSCGNDDGSHDDADHDDGDEGGHGHHFCHHHAICHSEGHPQRGAGFHHHGGHHGEGDVGHSGHELSAGDEDGSGCSSTGNNLAFWAFGILAMVTLLRPRMAAVRVRANRK